MAGVAENIQVVSSESSVVYDGELSPTDLTFNMSANDSTSLQELIESELALRIQSAESEPAETQQSEDTSPSHNPNERFIELERLHTAVTLNVFADTIDLSPDCEPASQLFPQYDSSPEVIPNSDTVAPLVNVESDESPLTEDLSDLEPIPLFTQTICSDQEQSPLTEVKPFIEYKTINHYGSDNQSPIRPFIENISVVVDPPDDETPNSSSPVEISPANEVCNFEFDSETNVVESSEPTLVCTENEIDSISETQIEPEMISDECMTKPEIDNVDSCVVMSNSMADCVGVVANCDTEWTTVEEAVKEVHNADQTASDDVDLDLHTTETVTTKTIKKKKSTESSDSSTTKTKKTKKTKKSEEKENHISVKSSFSKFDQLQKKAVLHVRSSDASKIQKQLNHEAPDAQASNPTCKLCSKTVFVMEQIKAERNVWHKNCFRCKECSKQLTVDTYQSHEGVLYCNPHFKELFKPKAVLDNDDEPLRRKKPEMIIRESQPIELPPEVARASDKADLGLEELSALNVKSRFQVFEKTTSDTTVERSPSTVNVKRSPSILSKLAKFQKKGMDVGVTDESLNGVDYEESSSSEDEAAPGEDGQVIKSSKVTEKPMSFNKMEDVKKTWETSGSTKTREELRAEHKKEISQIRSRLFQGKQGKMKEMYEQAVADSEGKVTTKKDQDIVLSEKARLLKERFERGEIIHSDSEEDEDKKVKNKEAEDMSVFEAGISKKSRSIFLELDATAAKHQTSPITPPAHSLTPRPTERRPSQTEESPDREIYRDPNVVRGEDNAEDESLVKRSQTASRMLSLFRQMEEQKETVPDGPKPLKCFTPPPDYKEPQSGSSEDEEEESEEEESEDDGIVKSTDKIEDEFLREARNVAKAKALKDKFEHWEPEKQSVNNAINLLDSEQESTESTKSLRARFESLKAEQPKEKPRPKVNRFVLQEGPVVASKCVSCDKTVYPLEKVEVDGKLYHANCFKCQQCHCKLRMDTYTLNNDHLYCLPHFRQLFIAKGNYDEGFGSNQHKRKWETSPVNGH